jgi:methionine-rich copper-binding protein CopC
LSRIAAALPTAVLLASAAVLLSWAIGPSPARAHAALISSVPAARAILSAPPARVTLTFNERLEPAYARVSVQDDAGTQIDLKDAALEREGGKVLTVSLPPLRPGRYTVRYRVLSVDGHIVEASFAFTVGAPARRP